MIMLAGIFYGAQYGGSVASILVNVPGTPTAAVTASTAIQMTRQGRAGVALFILDDLLLHRRLAGHHHDDALRARCWRSSR